MTISLLWRSRVQSGSSYYLRCNINDGVLLVFGSDDGIQNSLVQTLWNVLPGFDFLQLTVIPM